MSDQKYQRIGVYPGTFDPVTYGHLDIIKRGLKLVDKLIIGVATNLTKDPLFSLDDRVRQVRRETSGLADDTHSVIEVLAFDQLLMHFAESVGASILIRGLRAVSDFEYEFQMVGMNAHLNPDIETVFLMADAKYQPISSRLVKEIAALGGKINGFIPPRMVEEVNAGMQARQT